MGGEPECRASGAAPNLIQFDFAHIRPVPAMVCFATGLEFFQPDRSRSGVVPAQPAVDPGRTRQRRILTRTSAARCGWPAAAARRASSGLSAVRGSEGEAAATWAWSRRTQIGVRALAQNFGVGNASHLAAESLMLTVSRSLSPLTQVQLYGGPEYSQVHDTFTLNLPGGGVPIALTDRVYRVRTYPRFGAEVSHQDAGHPWSAQLQRQINNGGGALPFPVALTQAQFQCGPRLRPGWRLQFGANVAQMSALAAGNLASRVRMAAVSVTLTRRLSRELSLGLDYSYLAQRASGLIPLTPAVNRSLGGVRLDWVWPGSLESNY